MGELIEIRRFLCYLWTFHTYLPLTLNEVDVKVITASANYDYICGLVNFIDIDRVRWSMYAPFFGVCGEVEDLGGTSLAKVFRDHAKRMRSASFMFGLCLLGANNRGV